MKYKKVILTIALVLFGAVWSYEKAKETTKWTDTNYESLAKAPPCIRMYDYLAKYSNKYDVPIQIALGVAKLETRYEGPFDWDYNPSLTSSMKAYGAMQIQVPTAEFVWKKKVTKEKLLNDLEFNVETSMKLLKYLYSISGSWELALGYYNTGRPIVNSYSLEIMKHYK